VAANKSEIPRDTRRITDWQRRTARAAETLRE
jgi:hypothetical protein